MGEIKPAKTVACFCCGDELSAAMSGSDPWDAPGEGLRFGVHGTYGSSFFDSLVEGEDVSLQLVICDQCLTKNKARMRKIKYNVVRKAQVIDIDSDMYSRAEDDAESEDEDNVSS